MKNRTELCRRPDGFRKVESTFSFFFFLFRLLNKNQFEHSADRNLFSSSDEIFLRQANLFATIFDVEFADSQNHLFNIEKHLVQFSHRRMVVEHDSPG